MARFHGSHAGGARTKRKTPEEDLHRLVVDWLGVAVPPPSQGGPFWTHPHNEGHRTKADAGRAKGMGQRAGTPDLLFCHRGRFLGVELKAPKGTTSDAQDEAHQDITLAGGVVAVCRSLDEVKAFLAAHDVPMREARMFARGRMPAIGKDAGGAGQGAGWRHPKAARDVAPGEKWTFNHPTMAEVIAAEQRAGKAKGGAE